MTRKRYPPGQLGLEALEGQEHVVPIILKDVPPEATVTATSTTQGTKFTRATSSSGDFDLTALNPDIYTVTVTRPGFQTVTQENVHVNALETHLASHPEIIAMTKQAEIATAEARVAQAARNPDWTFEVAYQQRGPDFSNMVSLGLSVPLPWDRAKRQDREVASKLAMADQMRAQRDEMLRAHIGEVRAMILEWQNGRERIRRYERELVPLARERAQAALAGYQGGKTSITDLLGARRNEADVRMQAVQLEMDTARLWARLSFLIPEHALHWERK